jgi:V/A-type H+-transporting ATPase subunit C
MAFVSEIVQEFLQTETAYPPELIAAVFGVVVLSFFFITTLMGYFRTVLEIAFFSYPNALVTAKGNPCIEPANLERIVSTRTITGAIEETRRLGLDIGIEEESSADEIEQALVLLYQRDCELIESIAPGSVRPLFRAFCMLEEAAVIRAAIRARHAGLPPPDTELMLHPIGMVSPDLVHKMAAAQTMDDLISLLRETPFGEPLAEALDTYHEMLVPFPLETTLDVLAFEEMQAAVMLVDASHHLPASGFAGAYADTVNAKILLRAKKDRIPPDSVTQYLVSPGPSLPPATLKKMAEAASVEDAMLLLEGTELGGAVQDAALLYRQAETLTAIEKALDEWLLSRVIDLGTIHRFGPGPLITFLVARKFEVQNLRAIVWGMRAGMVRKEIASVLVYGRVGG